MLIIQFLVLTFVVSGVIIFVMKKLLFDTTQGAVNRLSKETQDVRAKQAELNEKIKQANEELVKRRAEADALTVKMKEDAENKAKEEREKIVQKARQDAEEIINKAQKTKDEIRRVIQKEMDMKAVDFTVVMLNELLSANTKGAFNESLINDFLVNVETVDMTMLSEEVNVAEVVVASPLDEKLRNRLSDILSKKLGRVVQINTQINEKILAGIILTFGSLSLNGSLQHMLKEKGVEIKEKVEKGLLKL